MLYFSYKHEIMHQYIHQQEWEFLQIKVPKINLASTLAVETVFGQMHALHGGKTFADIYVEGQSQLWYSLELISLGGKVSFVLRIPKKMRDLVEAAFYSQYPQAEITEIEDYMKNFSYDPENSDVEIFGTELKVVDDEVIPLKTYKDFEHQAAEETVIDPLSNLFESLMKVKEHEFVGIQLLIRPVDDDEWKPRGEMIVKKMIGEDVPHDVKFSDVLMSPINKAANFSFKDSLLGGGHGHGEASEKSQKNDWMSLTDTQKTRVGLIESKIGKPGYKTKIRILYIAPKAQYDPTKRNMFFGAFRNLGSAMTNKLKPDTKHWTGVDYMFSKDFEGPYLEYVLKQRKRKMFKGYKDRDFLIGIGGQIFNTEELATLYHFPITAKDATVATAIEKTESKKYQPPVDLPIAED